MDPKYRHLGSWHRGTGAALSQPFSEASTEALGADAVKFGLRLPTYVFDDGPPPPEVLRMFAVAAEQLGFESLWAVDHLMIAEPSYHVTFLDPMPVLTMAAADTSRIRIGTSILVLPLRHPVMLAKHVATLDFLCGGRFSLGVGSGWNEEEFDAVGVPFGERGRRTDEYLESMIALWTQNPARFSGRWVGFEGFVLLPRPLQSPYPRLCIGGGSTVSPVYSGRADYNSPQPHIERVLRRIARYANEWHAPSTTNLELMERDWQLISEYAIEYGRRPNDIRRVQTTYLTLAKTRSEARTRYERVMGKDFDNFISKTSLLFGDAEHIVEELHKRSEIGIETMILTPLDFDIEQLETWVSSIIAPLDRHIRAG